METRNNSQSELDKALYLAVQKDKYEKAESLIQSGAKPNAYIDPSNKFTCLHCAVLNKNTSMVELLLKAGAKIETLNDKHESPFWMAINKSFWSGIETIISMRNFGPGESEAGQALINAIIYEETSIALNLLRAGAPVNVSVAKNQSSDFWKKYEGWTPLHCAADKGYISLCQSLLQFGADPALLNNNGQTAYQVAKNNDNKETRRAIKYFDKRLTGKAIFEKFSSSLVFSDADYEKYSAYKEEVFAYILQIQDKQLRKMALEEAKNPDSALGKLFWYQRGIFTKPSLEKGMLNRIVKQLEQENKKEPVKVIETSTAKITSTIKVPAVQQPQQIPSMTSLFAASAPSFYTNVPLYPDVNQIPLSYSYPQSPVMYTYPLQPSAPENNLQPVYLASNSHSFTNQMNKLPKVADLPVLKKPKEVTTRKYEYGS